MLTEDNKYLFSDYVQLLKNILNLWLIEKFIVYDDIKQVAKWTYLKQNLKDLLNLDLNEISITPKLLEK